MEKTENELEFMRKAAEITCKRLQECLDGFAKFKTEGEVKEFLSKGLEMAFPPIVASGKNAAEPHYAGDEPLHKGFCVVDFGAKYQGYCADITRMVYIGEPAPEEVKLYRYVLKEHNKMIKQVKKGNSLRNIEKCFRRRIGEKNKIFIHRIGHGLGKEVHERCNKKLKENEVVTIEPGLYVKDKWGLRIEDDILVRGEILTESVSKELVIVN